MQMSGTTDIISAAIGGVGTLSAAVTAGIFAGSIAQRYQRRRALIEVRREMSDRMTSTVAEFLVISRQYHRLESPSEANEADLGKIYADTRVQADSIETKLKVYFGETGGNNSVYALWHTCSDLITIRYLALVNQLKETTISLNADKPNQARPHTRWPEEKLKRLLNPSERDDLIIRLGREAEEYCDRAVEKALTQRIEEIFPKEKVSRAGQQLRQRYVLVDLGSLVPVASRFRISRADRADLSNPPMRTSGRKGNRGH